MQKKINYRIYPSLLNSFKDYVNETGYENSEGDVIPFVTFEGLIDRINRVQFETTEAQQKGIDFEDNVIHYCKTNTLPFSKPVIYQKIVKEIGDMLPQYFVAQKLVQKQYKDILFYGKTDAMGMGRIVDIKTGSKYSFPQYLNSAQNLYLWASKDFGFKSLEYICTNFSDVFKETYEIDYNFEPLLIQMEDFVDFLNDNKELITDKRIFNQF